MLIGLPPPNPPSLMVIAPHVLSQGDAENTAAAAWLDLRRDGAFQRFLLNEGADPETFVAHPDGRLTMSRLDAPEDSLLEYRPFDPQGRLTAPFDAKKEAAGWTSSLSILIRYARALSRGIGRESIGVSKVAGSLPTERIERDTDADTHRARMASALRFLDDFAVLYGYGNEPLDGQSTVLDVAAFSPRFQRESDVRLLGGWVTGLREDENSPRATWKALGKLASMLRRAYAMEVVVPEEDSDEARTTFVDSFRLTITLHAATDGLHMAEGTTRFAAGILLAMARETLRMNVVSAQPVFPMHTLRASENESDEDVGSSHESEHTTGTTDQTTTQANVRVGVTTSAEDGASQGWSLVVKVTTFSGGVVVLASGIATTLSASQKAAVVTLGNAAALGGATVLAVVVPGVGHTLGVIGTSGLLFSSVVDYLEAEGISAGIAGRAAVVELGGVYILVGLGVAQSVEALVELKANPGWRSGFKATVSILATIGTVAGGAPAADKADRFNIDDAKYGFFKDHPAVPERLGHSGNGMVLLGQGTQQVLEDVDRREGNRSFWDVFLSSYDFSGIPYHGRAD